MAQAPFTYEGTLSFPPDIGTPLAGRPVSLAGFFESSAEFVYKLEGAGTHPVDFGTITPLGAKVLSIEVDPDSSPAARPILVTFNGAADGAVEIAPGGFLTVGSPNPTATGLLSLEIAHAANTTVRVRLLG